MPTIDAAPTAGELYKYGNYDNDWPASRDATSASNRNIGEYSATATKVRARQQSGSPSNIRYYVNRSFMCFDISGVTSTPSSATLNIHGYNYSGADQLDIIIIKADTAYMDLTTDVNTPDFDDLTGFVAGSTMAGNVTDYSSEIVSWSLTSYNTITLNAAALADMAALSVFKIAIVGYDYDYLNDIPADGVNISTGMYYGPTTGKTPYIDYVAGAPADPPDITSIYPARDLIGGGVSVTITGTDFINGATVTIGGVAATSVVFVSATELTAVAPAGTVGQKDVVVTNPDTQDDTLVNGFTYVNAYANKIIGIDATPSGGGSGTEYSADTDGYVTYQYDSWSTVHGASVGTLAVSDEDFAGPFVRGAPGGYWGPDTYQITRLFMAFDSSGISSGNPLASATLKLYGYNYPGSSYIYNGYIVLRATKPSLSTNLVVADFNNMVVGDPYSSQTTTFSDIGYFSITLNTSALEDLESLSTFKLAIVDYAYDYSNVDPGGIQGQVHFWMQVYMRDYGTSRTPKIEYILASEPGYSKVIEIAQADIFEINDA